MLIDAASHALGEEDRFGDRGLEIARGIRGQKRRLEADHLEPAWLSQSRR